LGVAFDDTNKTRQEVVKTPSAKPVAADSGEIHLCRSLAQRTGSLGEPCCSREDFSIAKNFSFIQGGCSTL
jgi:hypothetical protein